MDRKRMRFLILGGGVVLAMIFLILVGVNRPGGLAYYVTVSEFVEQPATATAGFRVNGKVAPGTIERLSTGEDVSFMMTDGTATLRVVYHGIIPDTFVDDADVVVEGKLRDDGSFEAQTLLAKCPSKYESADDAAVDTATLEPTVSG